MSRDRSRMVDPPGKLLDIHVSDLQELAEEKGRPIDSVFRSAVERGIDELR